MGISIEQWRMQIGLFGTRCKLSGAIISAFSLQNLNSVLLSAAVLCALLVIGNIEVNPGPFPCKICSVIPETISSSLQHQQYHAKDSNFQFFCPSPECTYFSKSFGSVRTHVSIFHRDSKHRSSLSAAVDNTQDLSQIKCALTSCSISKLSMWEMVQHYYDHLVEGEKVPCPFVSDCNFEKTFIKKSTFQVHLSQYHRGWNAVTKNKRKGAAAESVELNVPMAATEAENEDNFQRLEDDGNLSAPSQAENLEDTSFIDDSLVMDYIAKFYLQLYGDFFLPYDMIQEISNGLTFLSEIMHARIKRVLSHELELLNVSEEDIKRICYKVMSTDLLYASHHKNMPQTASLVSDHLRKKYFKENLGYKPPTEVNLDSDNIKSEQKYQFIPVSETLETVLQDHTVQEEIDASFEEKSVGSEVVSNYTDGTQFKSEEHPPKEIHLFLYQDGVNPVMNVLGSAKNKYKQLAMYFTIGNLKPTSRSKVASKHLVMLIREKVMKEVGSKICFEKVINNLKELEANGVSYKGNIVKVTVEFFVGDNLGQHFVGGYIESFSCTYFCRYCNIKRKDFKSNPAATNQLITREKYRQCAMKAELTGQIVQGIKANSPFNSFQYFHASSHLAPCLAHDLFEGVVSFDLSAIISILVKEKWFSYNLLNKRIRLFRCNGIDMPNKPAYVRSKGDKLGGHAVQNWTLLRLLPFILGNKIKNTDHNAWKLYLQLKELCEIFSSTKFRTTDVSYVKDVLLPSYYERRATVITDDKKYPLRPKHHYMSHYPELMLKFGPLIHLWSLPYEQMHKLFKTVCRLSRNFKNVEYTCAVRHQLHLAYLGTGPLLPEERSEAGPRLFPPHVLLRTTTCIPENPQYWTKLVQL